MVTYEEVRDAIDNLNYLEGFKVKVLLYDLRRRFGDPENIPPQELEDFLKTMYKREEEAKVEAEKCQNLQIHASNEIFKPQNLEIFEPQTSNDSGQYPSSQPFSNVRVLNSSLNNSSRGHSNDLQNVDRPMIENNINALSDQALAIMKDQKSREAKISDLETENKKLEDQLAEGKEYHDNFKKALFKVPIISEIIDEKQDLTAEFAEKIATTLRGKLQFIEILENSTLGLNKKLSKLQEQYTELKKKYTKLENDKDTELSDLKQKAERQDANHRKEKEDLNEKLSKLEAQYTELENDKDTELSDLKQKAELQDANHRKEKEDIERKIKFLDRETSDLRDALDTFLSRV